MSPHISKDNSGAEEFGEEVLHGWSRTAVGVRIVYRAGFRILCRRVCKGMQRITKGMNLPVCAYLSQFLPRRQDIRRFRQRTIPSVPGHY